MGHLCSTQTNQPFWLNYDLGRGFVVDTYFRYIEKDLIIPPEIKELCMKYYGALDDELIISQSKFKLPARGGNRLHYEYDSIIIYKGCKLIGERMLHIICLGDIILEPNAEINLDGSGYENQRQIQRNGNKLIAQRDRKLSTMQLGYAQGGGALKIECFGSIIMKSGSKISCNAKGRRARGSGEGGSIHITLDSANNLQMHKHATIEAKSCINAPMGAIRVTFRSGDYDTFNNWILGFTPYPYKG